MRRDSKVWKLSFTIETLSGIDNFVEMSTLLAELVMELKHKGYRIRESVVKDAEDE